jgi:hypothetical protein
MVVLRETGTLLSALDFSQSASFCLRKDLFGRLSWLPFADQSRGGFGTFGVCSLPLISDELHRWNMDEGAVT